MNRQELAAPSTRFPVWVVLLDHRSAAWLRWTASARALKLGATHPIRWIDSSAPQFRPQAFGFAPKTLEHTLFVRCAGGLWHSGFDALSQLEQLLGLPASLPRKWYQPEPLEAPDLVVDRFAAKVR